MVSDDNVIKVERKSGVNVFNAVVSLLRECSAQSAALDAAAEALGVDNRPPKETDIIRKELMEALDKADDSKVNEVATKAYAAYNASIARNKKSKAGLLRTVESNPEMPVVVLDIQHLNDKGQHRRTIRFLMPNPLLDRKPAVVKIGENRFNVRDKEKHLTEPQACIIEALQVAQKPLSLAELEKHSGSRNPAEVLKRLCKDADWASVIKLPGGKGKGGYSLKRA